MCVDCNTPPPPCSCKKGQTCVLTTRTCNACPQNICQGTPDSGGGGGNTATLGGAVGGVLAVLIIAGVVGFFWVRRRRREIRRRRWEEAKKEEERKKKEKRKTGKRETKAFVDGVARSGGAGGPGGDAEKKAAGNGNNNNGGGAGGGGRNGGGEERLQMPQMNGPFFNMAGPTPPHSAKDGASMTSSMEVNNAGHAHLRNNSGNNNNNYDPFGDNNSISGGPGGGGNRDQSSSNTRDSDAFTFRSSQSTSIIPIAYIPAHSSSLAIEDAEARGPFGDHMAPGSNNGGGGGSSGMESRNIPAHSNGDNNNGGRAKPDLRLSLPQSLRSRDSVGSNQNNNNNNNGKDDGNNKGLSPSVMAGLAMENLALPTPPPPTSQGNMAHPSSQQHLSQQSHQSSQQSSSGGSNPGTPLVTVGGKPIRPPRAPGLDLKLPEPEKPTSPGGFGVAPPGPGADGRPTSGFPWSAGQNQPGSQPQTSSATSPTSGIGAMMMMNQQSDQASGSRFSDFSNGTPSLLPTSGGASAHPSAAYSDGSNNSSFVNAYGGNNNTDSRIVSDGRLSPANPRPDTAMSHLSTISTSSSAASDSHLSYILDAPQIVTRQQIMVAQRPMAGKVTEVRFGNNQSASGGSNPASTAPSTAPTSPRSPDPRNQQPQRQSTDPFADDNASTGLQGGSGSGSGLQRKPSNSASRHLPKESFGLPPDSALFALDDEAKEAGYWNRDSRDGSARNKKGGRRSEDTVMMRGSEETERTDDSSDKESLRTFDAGDRQRHLDARSSVSSAISGNESIWTSSTAGPNGRMSQASFASTNTDGRATPQARNFTPDSRINSRAPSMASVTTDASTDSDLSMLNGIPFVSGAQVASPATASLSSTPGRVSGMAWPAPPARTPTTQTYSEAGASDVGSSDGGNLKPGAFGIEVQPPSAPPSATSSTFSGSGSSNSGSTSGRSPRPQPPTPPGPRPDSLAVSNTNRDSAMSVESYTSQNSYASNGSRVSVLEGIPFQLGFPGMGSRGSMGSEFSVMTVGNNNGRQSARYSDVPPLPNQHQRQQSSVSSANGENANANGGRSASGTPPSAGGPRPLPPHPRRQGSPPPSPASSHHTTETLDSNVMTLPPPPYNAAPPVPSYHAAITPPDANTPSSLPPTSSATAVPMTENSRLNPQAPPGDRSSIDTLALSAELAARFEGM